MVHRTMGLPHKSEPKNSYCVIWVEFLKQFYPSVIDGSVRYQTHKDLNEWLVSQSKVQENQPSLPTTKRGIRR